MESAEVNAGDDVLATQYNNLRKDVLDNALGHPHSGAVDGGLQLTGSTALVDGTVTEAKLSTGVQDKLMNLRTRPVAAGAWPELGLATILSLTGKGVLNGIGCIADAGNFLQSGQAYTLDITADGVLVRSITFAPPASTKGMWLNQALRMVRDSGQVETADFNISAFGSVNIYWTTSLLIEANKGTSTGIDNFEIAYAENI